MNLVETLIALRNCVPGEQSQFLHSLLRDNMDKCIFDAEKLHRAIDEIEFKSDLGIEITQVLCDCISVDKSDFSEIDTYLKQGQWITAIKIYRNKTGASFADSKHYIDSRRKMLKC